MDRYCPNCKVKIEDGKKFCGNCGFNISDFEDVTAKQSKRKSRVIYIVLICVTLCIIGIVVAFSIQNNRHEPTPIDNDEEYEVVTDETPSPTEEPGRSFNVGYTRLSISTVTLLTSATVNGILMINSLNDVPMILSPWPSNAYPINVSGCSSSSVPSALTTFANNPISIK